MSRPLREDTDCLYKVDNSYTDHKNYTIHKIIDYTIHKIIVEDEKREL